MDFQVVHPGRKISRRDCHVAQQAAMRAENHIPAPDDLRLNLFTDASPVSKGGPGGVGICYGRWLITQPVRMLNSLSFVVPKVHDANECELVALADAALVVIDEIKENLKIMKANDWKTSVMIWSDSHTALRFLEEPNNFSRFGPGRPTQVRGLILELVSEIKTLPVKGPVKFIWVPGLSTEMHRKADYMTKNSMVKSGKAPLSRAMKILFPKPTVAPHVPLQSMILTTQDSKATTMKTPVLEKKEKAIEGDMANKSFEEEDVPRGNKLKRSALSDVEIDSDKPRKIMRLTKNTPATSEYKATHQKKSNNTSADQFLAVAPPTNTVSSWTANARGMAHWSTNFGDCPGNAKPLAIYNFIKSSSCVQSFAKVLEQASRLRRGRSGQRAMIESAINEQLRANERLVSPAHFFLQVSLASRMQWGEPCFPVVTWSIVQAAVRRLPESQRAGMEEAVAEQLKVNCRQAIYRASLFYEPPQFD